MNEDTLHLLSECAAGTDMAIRSLEDVLKNSPEGPLQKRLLDSKRQHEQLAAQAADRLRRQGKEPKRATSTPQRTRTRGASPSRSSGWRTSWSRICGRICKNQMQLARDGILAARQDAPFLTEIFGEFVASQRASKQVLANLP